MSSPSSGTTFMDYLPDRRTVNNYAEFIADMTRSRRRSRASRSRSRSRSSRSSRTSMASRRGTQQGTFNRWVDERVTHRPDYVKRRKRRIPKRKLRRIRKFKRRVRKAVFGKNPTNVLAYRMSTSTTVGIAGGATVYDYEFTDGEQAFLGNSSAWGMWVGNGATAEDIDAPFEFVSKHNRVWNGAIVTWDTDLQNYSTYYMTHMELGITITNTCPDKTLMMDVYQFVAAQDISDSNVGNPVAAMNYILANLETAASRYAITRKGITPFQVPGLGKFWKVIRKDRILIPAFTDNANPDYNLCSREIKMTTKGYCAYKNINTKLAIKGKTKYFAFCLDPSQEANYNVDDPVCNFRVTKVMHYKHNDFARIENPMITQLSLTKPIL